MGTLRSGLVTKSSAGNPDKKLSADEMAVIVNALKLNTAVLSAAGDDLSELREFLTTLEKNKKNYPDNTRFQYLFNYSVDERSISHWSTVDIRISNGELEFYLLDGTNRLPGFSEQIALIEKICPNAKVRSTELGIQVDSESCAYVALSHAMSLAKIPDLHQQLGSIPEVKQDNSKFTSMFTYDQSLALCKKYESEASVGPYSSLQSNFNILSLQLEQDYSVLVSSSAITANKMASALISALYKLQPISRDMLPKTLGSLFKNTQRMSFNPAGYIRSNEEPLDVYFAKHKKTYMIKNVGLNERNAINDKSDKIKSATQQFLQDQTDQQLDNIVVNRKKEAHFSFSEEKKSSQVLTFAEELSILDIELTSFIAELQKLCKDSVNKTLLNTEILALTSIKNDLRILNFNDKESVNRFKEKVTDLSVPNTSRKVFASQIDEQSGKLFTPIKSSAEGLASEKVALLSKRILDLIEKNSALHARIQPKK